MGPRAGLDWCGISSPPPGFDPRTVYPVANRCTEGAIAARKSTQQDNFEMYLKETGWDMASSYGHSHEYGSP